MYNTNTSINEQWLNGVMSKVYATMGIGLAVTFIVAMFVAGSPALFNGIFGTALKWPVILAPLAFVFLMSFGYSSFQASTLRVLFYLFAILQGFSLSMIFLIYTKTSIGATLGMTSAMFLGMSVYGYFTKRSLHSLGGYLFVALIMLIVAMVVNIFLQSSVMGFVISIVGVLLFLALTAYDTQKIRDTLWAGVDAEKATIMGALTLYLDFINLFQFVLQLFGVKLPNK